MRANEQQQVTVLSPLEALKVLVTGVEDHDNRVDEGISSNSPEMDAARLAILAAENTNAAAPEPALATYVVTQTFQRSHVVRVPRRRGTDTSDAARDRALACAEDQPWFQKPMTLTSMLNWTATEVL